MVQKHRLLLVTPRKNESELKYLLFSGGDKEAKLPSQIEPGAEKGRSIGTTPSDRLPNKRRPSGDVGTKNLP